MKKVSLLSLTLIYSLVLIFASCQSSNESIEETEEFNKEASAYAEFEKIKNNAALSFQLTEEEYKILLSGNLSVLKDTKEQVTFSSREAAVTSVGSVGTAPTAPEEPTTAGAKVVVCEQYGSQYHCYELKNTAECPKIYSTIDNVTCDVY